MTVNNNMTVRDIAKLAQVNASTVSRAFNPKTQQLISEKVRERIFAIAEKHEYEPRGSARSLANGKSFQLGIILHSLEADLSSPNMSIFMSEFCREAMRQNYQTVLLPIEGGEFDKEVVKNIRSSKADGYFIASDLIGMQTMEELTKRHIPVASYISDKPVPEDLENAIIIHTDDSCGYDQMFKTIKERGFNEIALFCPEGVIHQPRMQVEPFCQKYQLKISERLTIPKSTRAIRDWGTGFIEAEHLFDKLVKHQLIFCSSDLLALGLCQTLHMHNIEPGKDISVVAYDNIEENPTYGIVENPFISTIDKKAGRQMVKLLLERIAQTEQRQQRQVVNIATRFIPRKSLGKVN